MNCKKKHLKENDYLAPVNNTGMQYFNITNLNYQPNTFKIGIKCTNDKWEKEGTSIKWKIYGTRTEDHKFWGNQETVVKQGAALINTETKKIECYDHTIPYSFKCKSPESYKNPLAAKEVRIICDNIEEIVEKTLVKHE